MLADILLEYNGTIVALSLTIYGIFSLQRGYVRQWGQTFSLVTGLFHVLPLSIVFATGFFELPLTLLDLLNSCILWLDAMGVGFFVYIFVGLLYAEYVKTKTPAIYPRPLE